MPKKIVQYNVFIASPNDVQNERNEIDEVVNELNLILEKSENININVKKWETHVYPNIGVDAQDVVN